MQRMLETISDLDKAGFKPIDERKSRHFAVIGKFILSISTDIDARLNTCLQLQINSGEEAVTRIMIGEMRSAEVIGNLKRIASSRNLESRVRADMNALFAEISVLRRVRDIIAHRVCMVAGNRIAFHNAFLARTDASIEYDVYTLKEIEEFSIYARAESDQSGSYPAAVK